MSGRWDPFDNLTSLRDTAGRLFDQHSPFGGRGEGDEGHPAAVQSVPVNVFEAEDLFMIVVPMPGLQEEDIDITVRGNTITLEAGERADLKPASGKRYLRQEWHYGPYQRTLELPFAVDAESAEATFGNGVLTVRLSKAETERVRRIQVRGGSSEGARAGLRGESAPSYGGGAQSQGDGQTIKPIEGVQHQTPGRSEEANR